MMFKIIVLVLFLGHLTNSQENAGTNVAPSLRICYNTTRYVTADYRLPASVNVFIDLIRRIEERSPSQDARELSFQLLHRFRQDGIRGIRSEQDVNPQGLPYSPKGWEAAKNRVQLTKLTPGNALSFNNKSLSDLEACSLHFMVSSTIDTKDYGAQCGRIARYTSRDKRQIELADSLSQSSCPIELGVFFTKWGAVKGGLVLAGIAAGFESNPQTVNGIRLESSYASTIAGELSEVSLQEVASTKDVGNSGSWNSTIEPKYYFLDHNDRKNLYLTDAEIRGGLDGLFLALNIQNWRSQQNNLKISQILDLYYSRGVFNESAKACNRKNLLRDIIQDPKLVNQTAAFNGLLDRESSLNYSPDPEKFLEMATAAVNSLRTYLNSNLNDLDCSAEDEITERVSADVLIFVDTDWRYEIINPLISYILDNIDVNKYESSYTILNGANGDTIVNKSRSILDFHEQFNVTEKDKHPRGFDYNRVIQVTETLLKQKLNNKTDIGVQSIIVLMLPHNTPTSSQSSYARDKRDAFVSALPDLRIIVGGSGSRSSYNDLVKNPNNDIFTIPENNDDSAIKEAGKSIVSKLKTIPRSVINPECGASFSSGASHSFDASQFVEPSGINFHSISSNYFYEGQTLKIRGQGSGSLTVCTSRTDANPRANTTGIKCQTITSDEVSIDVSSYCIDQTVRECSPIYISVQGVSSQGRCTDQLCRFPDSIKYTITLENVRCSSASKILLSVFLISALLFVAMSF